MVILSWDESEMKCIATYEDNCGRLVKASKILVVEAKSLTGKFKQIVYVDFVPKSDDKDSSSTEGLFNKDVLCEIIDKLKNESGVTVVGTTCDNGSSNVKLWEELGVNENETSFVHNGDKIFCFSDHSHCVKLARNHFVTKKFRVHIDGGNGKMITHTFYPRQFLTPLANDLSSPVLWKHLNVDPNHKQNVKLALGVINKNGEFTKLKYYNKT